MFCPIIPSEKEIDEMCEAERKEHEEFARKHGLLSTLFDLIQGLALISFWLTGLFFLIYWVFFCP